MSVIAMCEGCANLYTGDKSCMIGVPPAERARRAETGRCDEAAKLIEESGHTLRAAGSKVQGKTNRLWEFVRAQDQ